MINNVGSAASSVGKVTSVEKASVESEKKQTETEVNSATLLDDKVTLSGESRAATLGDPDWPKPPVEEK